VDFSFDCCCSITFCLLEFLIFVYLDLLSRTVTDLSLLGEPFLSGCLLAIGIGFCYFLSLLLPYILEFTDLGYFDIDFSNCFYYFLCYFAVDLFNSFDFYSLLMFLTIDNFILGSRKDV
jgi:hypothetical protein